jgi:hypothetical protein
MPLLTTQDFKSRDLMGLFQYEEELMYELLPYNHKRNREVRTLYLIGNNTYTLRIEIHGEANDSTTYQSN